LKSHSSDLIALSSKCVRDFANEILKSHNKFRALHNVSSLKYSLEIEKTAHKYADFLSKNDLFQHSHTNGLGENLAASWSSNKPNTTHCSSYFSSFSIHVI